MLTGASAQDQALGACRVSRKQKEEGTRRGAGGEESFLFGAKGCQRPWKKTQQVLECFVLFRGWG